MYSEAVFSPTAPNYEVPRIHAARSNKLVSESCGCGRMHDSRCHGGILLQTCRSR